MNGVPVKADCTDRRTIVPLTHNIVVVNVPSILDKHPECTDASLYRHAANELDGGHGLSDVPVREAIAELCRRVADELEVTR